MHTSRAGRVAALTVALGGLALAAAPSSAVGQTPTAVNQSPGTQEFGLDAGLTIGLGDRSSIQFTLPASRARVGFFLSNESRWSIEPAIGLSYIKVEDADGALLYNLEAGALYHFRTPGDLIEATGGRGRTSVAYARPFVNLTGITGDGGDNEVSVGAGLGIKVPWRENLAWRYEANLGYGFDNQALRLGALVGVSFFTRNLIR